jgi:hypothetical protein
LGEELTAVVLESLLTTCGAAESSPLLAAKVVSPLYEAVMVWLPTANAVVLKVALAALRATPEASVVAPSRKFTVPVGVPA